MKEIIQNAEGIIQNEDLKTITEERLISLVIQKHDTFASTYKDKILELEKTLPGLEDKIKTIQKERDNYNKMVQEKKEIRTSLFRKIKENKDRYLTLINESKLSSDDSKRMRMYQSQLRDVDWKLETEGIDLETERRLMEEAKLCYAQINKINRRIEKDKEREDEISRLEKEILQTMVDKEKVHGTMLELVKEGNVHHEELVKIKKEFNTNNWELERMKRWIIKHDEALEYWTNREIPVYKEKEIKTKNDKPIVVKGETKRKMAENVAGVEKEIKEKQETSEPQGASIENKEKINEVSADRPEKVIKTKEDEKKTDKDQKETDDKKLEEQSSIIEFELIEEPEEKNDPKETGEDKKGNGTPEKAEDRGE